jgi:CHAD domain-containing protein
MAQARAVPGLTCDESFQSAAGKIVWTRFEEMMSFTAVAIAGEDIEGVHDMRVASRRLRAALELFSDAFPADKLRPMLRQVKTLADILGEVRDRDVLIQRLTADILRRPPSQANVLREVIAEAEMERKKARKKLRRAVRRLEEDAFHRQFLAFVAKAAL